MRFTIDFDEKDLERDKKERKLRSFEKQCMSYFKHMPKYQKVLFLLNSKYKFNDWFSGLLDVSTEELNPTPRSIFGYIFKCTDKPEMEDVVKYTLEKYDIPLINIFKIDYDDDAEDNERIINAVNNA